MARQHQLSRNSPPNIPDEIIATDILPRLPVKSLLRFKSVCKRWCALISDPFFVAAHLDRSKNSPKLAILVTGTMFGDEINVYRYDEQGRHYASFLFGTRFPEEVKVMWRPQQSNGLFLLQSNGLLLVCNPSTRDFTVLPQGSRNPSPYQWRDNDRTGFGYVPSVNAYKVAQYFYRRYSLETRTCSIGFQVLTLGADSSWRDTAVDPPYPIDLESSPACGGGGNCRIYYKIDNRLHTSPMEFILSFDLRDETFAVIPQPYTCITSIDRRFFGTSELGGTLCFLTRSADWKKFEIWMYKDCAGGGSWAHA